MNRIFPVLLIACVAASGLANAQSLSQELLAEDAAKLAKAARERGDFVRGAILYPQKNLSCPNCHAPGARDLGPALTQVGKVDDEYIVDSILRPSKVIKKGYESVQVLTRDGGVVIGRIVQDDDAELVLRDTKDGSRLIKIARADVDEVRPNEKSTMPDGLVDQLADRQQFLDLVKYLMEIAATGQLENSSEPLESFDGAEVGQRIQGLVLLDDLNCTRCHRSRSRQIHSTQRAPILQSSAALIDPDYLQRFISDPLHVKSGTSMPDMMGSLEESEKQQAAEAITQYLVSLSDKPFLRQPIDRVAAARGRDLFHSIGCVACHSPRDAHGNETMTAESVALGKLEAKYNVQGLAAFLEDPHAVRPSGRMPNMVLTHWEAIDLANYLLGRVSDEFQPFQRDDSRVEAGKGLFMTLGCVKCHDRDDNASSQRGYTALAKLRLDEGCLSSGKGAWPTYNLNPSQLNAIRTAIEKSPEPLSDHQQITLTMQTFRCFACHQRDDLGGVSDERNVYFQTTNENLGPQGRIPPTLTGVGAKLKPKWMRQVLVSGRAIRPYMMTRMPQYGAGNVSHLVDLFQQQDRLPAVEFGEFADHNEASKIGTQLVGSGGLNCIACHTFQQKLSQTMPAVDLTEMAERLHQQWFYAYMRSPQSLSPNTVMPSFWPGGKTVRADILDGNTNQQIEAIWEYLLDGRQARTPRGLHQEPIEVLATDQAVMLRRSYQGIGKRGIGVGYPGGVNLAFDAEQMRIAMIWKGKFAEASGVWRGQGSGNVRPLGGDLFRFAAGPELDHIDRPWVVDEGRPPNHQFTGYSLDSLQRPTFTYRFDTIKIEDYAIDANDERSGAALLRRTLTFFSERPRNDLAFRAGTSDEITAEGNGVYLLGGSLRIRVDGRQQPKIVETDDGKQLLIPLEIPVGKSELVIEYAW